MGVRANIALRIGVVVAFAWPSLSMAQLLRDVSGQVDVAAVQSDISGAHQNSLRGLYRATWARNVLPYLQLRAGVVFSRYDLEIAQGDDAWREDFRPSGSLTWRHPGFTLGVSGSRRESTARVSLVNVTRDDIGVHFRTRATDWPILTLRYDDAHTFDDVAPARDTKDRRFVSELTHSFGEQTTTYRYQHRWLENVITSVDTDEDIHHFDWSGRLLDLRDGRIQLHGGYRYEHRRRADDVLGSGVVFAPVQIVQGLYARDPSPELDALAPEPGLVDGDVSNPTSPPIDIGGAFSDQNLGADFRVPTAVVAVYVYVDGPSGTNVTWNAYTSDDNVAWRPVTPGARSSFDLANSRYEITFEGVEARYVKVVNVGTNEVLDVRVTEIEAFEAVSDARRSRTVSNMHIADARATYEIRSNVFASADFTYQHVPTGGFRASRDDYAYSITTRYTQSERTSHTARFEQEFQPSTDERFGRSANALTYTLNMEPLTTIRSLLNLRGRRTYLGGDAEDDVLTALARVRLEPFPRLSVTTDVTRSRTEKLLEGTRFDTWMGRVDVMGAVTAWLDVEVGTRIQDTRVTNVAGDAIRRGFHVRTELRPTRTILLRGAVVTNDDRGNTTTQDYLLSWRLTRLMSLSSQVLLNRSRNGGVSDRYSANVTHAIGRRGSVYVVYTHLYQRDGTEEITNTFLQGVRYAF